MTKQRAPLTFAEAMVTVAGRLGYERAACVADRQKYRVYKWADPDSGLTPPIDIALRLDAAYVAEGGETTPFLDALAHQLQVHVENVLACHNSLLAELAIVSREHGEAVASILQHSHSNASPGALHVALREATQADTAWGAIIRRLSSFLPRDAVSRGEKPGANL